MEKSVKDEKPWNYGLMQYRTTPISSTFPSLLEMLTGRRPHSTLPQLPLSIEEKHGNLQDSRRIAQEATQHFHRSPHGIGPWTTCLCQGSEWKCLEDHYCWSTSSWAWFILGEISRQFHTEKDQVNDQTQVSAFSFWAASWSTAMELWGKSLLTFFRLLQSDESGVNVASHTNGKCDHTSNQR